MSIARKILDYKKELKSEAKGMGQEGRAYMRDKLKGKKYGGKLKDKYKDELAKEAFKLSPKGKKFLKKELDKPKPHNKAEEIIKQHEEINKMFKKDKDEPKKYAGGGGAVHHPVKAQPEDLVKKKKEGGEIKEYSGGGEAKDWIQGAVKKPGALRAVAKKEGLIKGDEKLSGSDLSKLAAQAKKKNNKLLAKRVSLAKTFAKMRKS